MTITRLVLPSLLALAVLAGCNAPPAEKVDVQPAFPLAPAPRPPLGYSDADVERMRQTIKTILYPQPKGATTKALGLPPLTSPSMTITEYKSNAAHLHASYEQKYTLNHRYSLVVIEHQYVDPDGRGRLVEQSASIQPMGR